MLIITWLPFFPLNLVDLNRNRATLYQFGKSMNDQEIKAYKSGIKHHKIL